jgi:hypothetical protein
MPARILAVNSRDRDAYGILAAYTPVMHLRRVDGAFFNTYVESFERVWASARVPSVPGAGAS